MCSINSIDVLIKAIEDQIEATKQLTKKKFVGCAEPEKASIPDAERKMNEFLVFGGLLF